MSAMDAMGAMGAMSATSATAGRFDDERASILTNRLLPDDRAGRGAAGGPAAIRSGRSAGAFPQVRIHGADARRGAVVHVHLCAEGYVAEISVPADAHALQRWTVRRR